MVRLKEEMSEAEFARLFPAEQRRVLEKRFALLPDLEKQRVRKTMEEYLSRLDTMTEKPPPYAPRPDTLKNVSDTGGADFRNLLKMLLLIGSKLGGRGGGATDSADPSTGSADPSSADLAADSSPGAPSPDGALTRILFGEKKRPVPYEYRSWSEATTAIMRAEQEVQERRLVSGRVARVMRAQNDYIEREEEQRKVMALRAAGRNVPPKLSPGGFPDQGRLLTLHPKPKGQKMRQVSSRA